METITDNWWEHSQHDTLVEECSTCSEENKTIQKIVWENQPTQYCKTHALLFKDDRWWACPKCDE